MIARTKAGCLVSYDVNYRAALWTVEEARKTQLPLMEYVDILITSLPDQPDISELLSGLTGKTRLRSHGKWQRNLNSKLCL